MRNYLVVANQTLGGEHLTDLLKQRQAEGSCHFHLVVPATRVRENWTHTEGEARVAAERRLGEAIERFASLGLDIDGEVGVTNPLDAIADAVADALISGTNYDEIILSTLPPGPSLWLHQDLPHRVAATFDVPLVHVIAAREPVGAGRPA